MPNALEITFAQTCGRSSEEEEFDGAWMGIVFVLTVRIVLKARGGGGGFGALGYFLGGYVPPGTPKALGYFLGGYVLPRTPNWYPVLKKISPKIDTPF